VDCIASLCGLKGEAQVSALKRADSMGWHAENSQTEKAWAIVAINEYSRAT